MINYKTKEVTLRLTKTRNEEKVDFDEDIIKIIDKCKELRKKLKELGADPDDPSYGEIPKK